MRRSDLPVRHGILEQRSKVIFRRRSWCQFRHPVLWQGSLDEVGYLFRAVTQPIKTIRNLHLLHHLDQAVGQNPTGVGLGGSFGAGRPAPLPRGGVGQDKPGP